MLEPWFVWKEIRKNGNKGMVPSGQDPHPANLAICEKKRPKKFFVSKEQQTSQGLCKCNSRRKLGSIPSSRTWQHQPHSSDFRVQKDAGVKGWWSFTLWLSQDTEIRGVAGEALPGGRQRPFHQVKKAKPGLCLRSHTVKDAIWYLPRNVTHREWNQPKGKKYASHQSGKGFKLSSYLSYLNDGLTGRLAHYKYSWL